MSSLNLFESSWVEVWGDAADYESVGVIYTKPAIVELILDLAGYTPAKRRLAALRLLEPSCGDGAFLRSIVRRLVASEKVLAPEVNWKDPLLESSVRAADINEASVEAARTVIIEEVVQAGCPRERAEELAGAWILHTDFLLTDWPSRFDVVVGNPPYVRLEAVPKPVLARYRSLFATATDRADLYVAFIEHGLSLLSESGVLAYICANRFTKNQYGAPLRRLIATKFRVRWYLNLEHTQPFETDVSAYPGIFIIDRQRGNPTLSATLSDLDQATIGEIREVAAAGLSSPGAVSQFDTWYEKGDLWTTTSADESSFLKVLESGLPLLGESGAGTKVGIGVATGADRIFVLASATESIEAGRQLPLAMAADVTNTAIDWSGHYLVNPFEEDGSLVDLARYPKLAAYFKAHEDELVGRHVAKKNGDAWYRTIDRVMPGLLGSPKLLIPDIRGVATIGVDDGRLYPHHNLYWITSATWDLRALKALLRSTMVLRQVRAYSVAMRGGHLRFQAQTLRRLRVPSVTSLSRDEVAQLVAVAGTQDPVDIDGVVNPICRRLGVPIG